MIGLTDGEIGIVHNIAQFLIDSGFAKWYDGVLGKIIPYDFGVYVQIILLLIVMFLIFKFKIRYRNR